MNDKPFVKAVYLWGSRMGSYHVDCKIYNWDEFNRTFHISFYDNVLNEEVRRWVPYDYVEKYSWKELRSTLRPKFVDKHLTKNTPVPETPKLEEKIYTKTDMIRIVETFLKLMEEHAKRTTNGQ